MSGFLLKGLILQIRVNGRRLVHESANPKKASITLDDYHKWENKIDFPIHMEQSIKRGKPIPKIRLEHVGLSSVIGRRHENQDRTRAAEIDDDLLYFGIYDGHGGSLAANFVADQMQRHIERCLKQTSDLQTVLRQSFLEVNDKLTEEVAFRHKGEDCLHSGTTATVALLRNSVELVIGHVGDSRALLSRKGHAMRLTKDHEPDSSQETERIESSGGHIHTDSMGRPMVNGILAMTRSIGDCSLKPFGVIATPDTRSVGVRHSKDNCLVLLTDGVSFIMNNQEIIDTVTSCPTPREAAPFLTEEAMQLGAEDNCSAIVIPFGAWGKHTVADMTPSFRFSRSSFSSRDL